MKINYSSKSNTHLKKTAGVFKVLLAVIVLMVSASLNNAFGQYTATLASSNPAVAAASSCAGDVNVQIYNFSIALSTGSGTKNLTAFDFVTTGTYVASDISNFKLWYNTSNTLSGATQVGSTLAPAGPGTQTFASVSQTFPSFNATYYFFVTMDVAAAAVNGHNITVSATTTSDFTTGAGSTKAGSAFDGGTQTINKVTSVISGTATICNGASTTISIALTGSGTWDLTYTDGTTPVSVIGTTTNPYTFSASPSSTTTYTVTSLVDDGTFCTAVAANKTGSAVVTVNQLPAITVQPVAPATLCAGSTSGTISVTATGAGLTYQWRKGGVNLTNSAPYSGVTTSTLTITNPAIGENAASIDVVVSGTCAPPVTSSAVSLTVVALPAISVQPSAPAAFCAGSGSGTISVTATGAGLTYQWKKGGVALTNTAPYSGVTTSTLTITSPGTGENGASITCVVSGTCAPAVTSSAVTVTVNALPAITVQPVAPASFCAGSGTGTISVTATGAGLTYQWRKGGVNLTNSAPYSGVTGSTLTITSPAIGENAASIDVVVTGTCAPTVTSSAVSLSVVNTTPAITVQPVAPAAFCAGSGSSTISVTATGAGLTYQWRKGGVNLTNTAPYSGVTGAVLTITSPAIGENAASIDVVISGTCTPSVTSSAVSLIVNALPAITVQPVAPAAFCAGSGTGTISVTATGAGLTYQWKKGGVSLSNDATYSGVTTSTLTITSPGNTENGASITCVVSGTCTPAVTSSAVTLTVNALPAITVQPAAPAAFCAGSGTGTISVTATGGALTYQWRKGGVNLTNTAPYSGVTTATLTITSPAIGENAANIDVVVSGCAPSVTSSVVSLTVNALPAITVQPVAPAIFCPGAGTHTISVTATGPGLTYQWRKGGVNLTNSAPYSGVTGSTLTITSPAIGENGASIDVVVFGTCSPAVISNAVTVTVAAPVMTSASSATICTGGTVNIPLTSSIAGSTFTWIAADNVNTTGESLTTQSTSPLNNTITNNTTSAQVVVYTVTPTNCVAGSSQTVNVTVNPHPTMTSSNAATICSGAPVSIPLTSDISASYSWIAADNLNTTGESLTPQSANPLNNTITSTATSIQVVSYTVTPTSTVGNCVGTGQPVSVTVNPTPMLSSGLGTFYLCNGTTFNYNPTSATGGASFSWTRATVANITQPGVGPIAGNVSEVLTNTSGSPINVTYVFTTTANSCSNTGENVVVAVNVPATAVVVSGGTPVQTVCSGVALGSTIVLGTSPSVPGTTFTWTRSNSNVTGLSSGSGNISGIMTNTTTSPQTVIFTITPSCAGGTPTTATVVVNPSPSISSTLTPAAVCSGSPFSYAAAASSFPGATFTWTRPLVTDISPLTNSGATNIINETLTNASGNNINVTYNFITTDPSTGCNNSATLGQNVVVSIQKSPAAAGTISGTSPICHAQTYGYSVPGIGNATSYTWSYSGTGGTIIGTSSSISVAYSNTATAGNLTVVGNNSCGSGTASPNFAVAISPDAAIALTSAAGTNAQTVCLNTPIIPITYNVSGGGTGAIVSGLPAGITGGFSGSTFTIKDSSVVVGNYTYTITTTGTCVQTTAVGTIIIAPLPTLNSSLTPPAMCSNSAFNYTPSSPQIGATFTWTRAVVAGITNAAGSGNGNPNEILYNNTLTAKSVTYLFTVHANGCTSASTYAVIVSVNPIALLSSSLTPPDICSGASFSYSPTSSTGGAAFAWSRAVVPGISQAANTGTNSPNEILTNTTTSFVNVIYTYTITANGCSFNQDVTVKVNATPTLSSSLAPPAACSGTAFNYSPTSATAGAVFSWTRAVVVGISNGAGAGLANPFEVLNNTTTSPVSVAYIYTVTANGCVSASTATVNVVVNPLPTLSSGLFPGAICSGATFHYTPSSATSGATFPWSRAAVAGISNVAAVGTGDPAEILVNTSPQTVNVVYVFSTTANGCSNSENVTVQVYPVPFLNSSLTPTVCSGSSFNYNPTSATVGATFTWTRAVTAGISNGASSGFGVPFEVLNNTTSVAVNATYAFTTSANGCTNPTPINVVVTVYPVPSLSSSTTPPAICSGVAFNYAPSSSVAGAAFAWQRSAVPGISNLSNSGTNSPGESLINTSTTPINVTYVYTITANGCSFSQNVFVTVYPVPTLNSNLTPSSCSGVPSNYSPTSATPGATFTWTRAVVAGISNSAGSGAGILFEILDNTTSSSINVTYVFTIAANGCTNPVPENVVVTVFPKPTLSSSTTPPAICSGIVFNYAASSAVTGATFAWSRATIPGISNAAATGTGNPGETLINTSPSPINVTYVYTTTANGCSNNENVIVTVYPSPTLNSSLTPTVCSGSPFNYSPSSATPGATFTWTRAVVAGISNSAGAGTGTPFETLINTTTGDVTVTYDYQAAANGCTNPAHFLVVVTVYPKPVLSSSVTPPPICSGIVFNYTPASATTGATFSWIREVQPGISNAANSGTNSPGEALNNTTTALINVPYIYTITANGCSFNQNVIVTVYPTPTLSSSPTPTVCSGSSFSYQPASATPGASFTWTRGIAAGIINSASSGTDNPFETLVNTTTAPATTTYDYVVTANGCTNPTHFPVVVTVYPRPVLSSPTTPNPICSGVVFHYTPTSVTAGVTFSWIRASVPGISNAAATGLGDPAEALINTAAIPINVTYSYSLTASGCTNFDNVVETIYPVAKLNSPLNAGNTCSYDQQGYIFQYVPTSATPGANFTWTRAVVAGVSNGAGSGNSNVYEGLDNVTNAAINVSYIFTTAVNGCVNSHKDTVVVSLLPRTLLTSPIFNPAFCSGGTFTYHPTSNVPSTYNWYRPAVSGILQPASSGVGNVSEVITNLATFPIVVTYQFWDYSNIGNCLFRQDIYVTVNPTPVFSSSLRPPPICSGSAFYYVPQSGTALATFAWTRAAVAGISNPAASGTDNPNEILNNTTSNPINVSYIYTTTASGCSRHDTVIVAVNLVPTLTSSLTPPATCTGTIFYYSPTSATAGVSFTWTRATVAGITNTASFGVDDPQEILINTTANPITVHYIYSVAAFGCPGGATYDVAVSVKPSPALSSSVTPPSICGGSPFSYTPTSLTAGTTFSWTRATVPGISNPASFGSNNPNETLTKTAIGDVNVTYIYTLTANGCTNPTTFSVVVVVTTCACNHTLSSTLTPPDMCSGTAFSYTPASTNGGNSFDWTRAVVPGIGNTGGSGNGNPNEVLNNTGATTVAVTYIYQVTMLGDCTNPVTFPVVVNVLPKPTLSSSLTPPGICSGNTFTYAPTSSTAGATFNWARAAIIGISNPGNSGTNNPNEILNNTTTSPINVTYVYTLAANGCSNLSAYNVVVVVNPVPTLSSSIAPPAICSGATFSYTAASATPGATFTWARAAVAGISNTAASGVGNVFESLTNVTASPVTVTYVYGVTANGCVNGSTYNVTVVVNPTPRLSGTLTPSAICSGNPFSYTPSSATAGATYGWSRAAVGGISNSAASGVGTANETLTNTTANPLNVTYTYTTTANSCSDAPGENVVVLVNPTPTLNSSLTPPAICSGSAFSYLPTSATVGSSFTWSRALIVGISNAAASSTGNPNEVLTNTTTSPINVTYVYQVAANGCTNPTLYNVVVAVNIIPTLTSTLAPPAICSGASFSYTPTSATPGTSFTWARAAVAGISNVAGSGSDNPNEILINTTASNINVTYVYTVSANGCTNATLYNVVVRVNPTPALSSSLAPPAICSGTIFHYTPTSAVLGTTFAWSRATTTGISNIAASGTNDPSEQLTNTTTAAVNVTYVYTTSANACTINQNVILTVNPIPVLNSTLTPPAICSNTTFSYAPTSATAGATFAWTRATVIGISNTAGSGGGNPNEILINTTAANLNVDYIYTVTANTCINPVTYDVTVTVYPTPTLTSSIAPPSICSSTAFSYSPTSATAGVTFAWTRGAVAGISNAAGTGNGNPNETLINTTVSPVNVTYVYTLTSNGCINPTTYNVVVTVKPTPILTSTLTPAAICNTTVFAYSPTSATPGTTFAWTRAAVAGISNIAASGTDNPNETLTNTTTAIINVTYVYISTANSCSNSPGQNVVVAVNPNPLLNSSLTPPAVCSGSVFSYAPTSATSGASFTWTRATVVGISNIGGSGSANPNETLVNTTTSNINVTYVYTVTANGCVNPATYNVVVPVNLAPALSSSLTPPAICSGTAFSYSPTSPTGGAAFAWSRAGVVGISEISASGFNNPNETLDNTTTAPINVVYVYTISFNGCTNPTTYNVVVRVNPNPILTSTLTPLAICSGTTFNYSPTSATIGATFPWTRATVVGISNGAGSGTNDPNEVLTNTTVNPLNVVYAYSVTANGCSNIQNVTVSVKPTPVLSSSLTPPSFCSGTPFSYAPTSATVGAAFAWTRAAVVGINSIAGSGSGNPNETLTNTTASPVNVTYQYTVSANGCSNPAFFNVVVTVLPTPLLTSSLTPPAICSGTTFNYNPTSATAGVSYTWVRAAVVGISNPGGSGVANVSESLTNTTIAPINVTYVFTLSANGCTNGTPYSVVVTVNPTPVLNSSLAPPSICSGTAFSYSPTSATIGSAFAWTRASVAGVSNLAGSGTNNPNEVLTNTTTATVNVTYTYITTANSCSNSPGQSVVVSVNPNPVFSSSLAPPSICSGTLFSYAPTSTTGGATFAWSRAAVAGISNIAGSGAGNPNETLINTTAADINVTYVYSVTANGCTNPAVSNVVLTVKFSPTLSSSLSPPAVCSNTVFSYAPTSATAGALFAWSRAAVAGITNIAASGTNNPNETLINTTAAPVNVTYIFSTTSNGCSNNQNVSLVVNPTPTLSSTLSPSAVCSGSPFNYTPTSPTSGATMTWTRGVVAGISNGVGSGSGNPNETLINTTTSAVNVTYVYTVAANGCINPLTYNVILSINTTPTLSSSLTPPAICSGSTFNYTPTSATLGATLTWSRAAILGISNTAGSGTGDPNEVLVNTVASSVNVTYVYVVAANGCTNVSNYNVIVTVFPKPLLTSSLLPPAICSGTAFNYTPSSGTGGTVFSWTRAAVAGITNIGSGGTGNPSEILTNTTTDPISVTYVYSLTANSCANAIPYNVVVVVNPTPGLTSTLAPPAICSGTAFSYTPASATIGATFGWTRAVVAGISNLAGSGPGNPNEVLNNTTSLPVNVTYVYTVTANGCVNASTYNVVVSVNQTPTLNSSLSPPAICSNGVFNYSPTSPTPGAAFAWTRAAVPGISNIGGSGAGNPSETLINTTSAPISVTYIYSVSANGCNSATTYPVVVLVNPTPALSSTLSPPAICNNTAFNYTPLSATAGAVFTYTRAVVAGISNLAGSGSANPNETLINTTTAPITVTYVYTVSANTCTNPATFNVLVTVNPTPLLTSSLAPPAICSGSAFSYSPTSSTLGAVLTWTRATVAGISNIAGSGSGNPNEVLNNTTLAPINVTYVYTVAANGCTNPSTYQVVVTVNLTPALTSSLSPPAICSGSAFSYTPTSTIGSTVFSWTRAVVPGISNILASGTANPNEVLTNTTPAPINVTYDYTVSSNGCTNAATYGVVVAVNPTPALTSTLTPSAICSGTSFNYPPASSTIGATFAWTRAAVIGISNIAGGGAGNPNETLTNTSTAPVNVTYIYTITANSCTNPSTSSVVVTVYPVPLLTSGLAPPAICSGTTFSYLPTSLTAGTSFAWTRAAIAGISNIAGTGTGNPLEALTNITAAPINVTYVYTLTANSCTNASTSNVIVIVNPTPALSSSLTPPPVCSGSPFNYAPISPTSGASFAWTRASVSGISNSAGSGVGSVSEVLINTTTSQVNVTYIYTVSANGCTSVFNVVVVVNPTPTLSSTLAPPAICSGTAFFYLPTSPTAGSTFPWTRAAVPGISNLAGTGTGNPNEILNNTILPPVTVNYIYSVVANGCTNPTTYTVAVIVNPTPGFSSSLTPPGICSGTTFAYTPTSGTPGATFAWSRAAVVGISNIGATGTDNPNEVLNNTTAAPINVTYIYTLAANGCTNITTYPVVVAVNPTPILTSILTPSAICSGAVFSYTPTSSTAGAAFAWTRALIAGISNIAGGGINNPNELLINTTASPINVIYVYTVSANGCTNASTYNVVVTVNPTPLLSSTVTPAPLCSGTSFSYVPTSATAGTSFSWTRASVIGISNSAASGINNPNEVLNNTIATPVNVTYVYTLAANSCTNASTYNVVVTVYPIPTLSSSFTPPAFCSGAPHTFNYVPTSPTPGTIFAWTRAAVVGISNVSGNGNGNPNEVLNNTTTSAVTVTYVYTLSANGCTNSTPYNVVVTVNPSPALTSSLTPPALCSGTTFNYIPTSAMSGVTFNWTRATDPWIVQSGTAGAGVPNETLTLSDTSHPENVHYIFTLSTGLCTNGTTYDVVIRVNKACICNHSLSSTLAPPAICSASTFSYIPTSTSPGASFTWTRAAVVGISQVAANGTGNPNEPLTNTTIAPINVTYTYSVSANSCTNPNTFDVVVVVNPTATLSTTLLPPAICSGSFFNYSPAGPVASSSFGWTRSSVIGIAQGASFGSGNPNELLTNTTAGPISVNYVYSATANSCTNPVTYNVAVIVAPAPTLSSTLTPPAICSGTVFSYTPTSATAGGSFDWTRATVTGISNAPAAGNGNPNETLTNTTAGSVNVTYVYTVTANGCTNPSTFSVVVTVSPTPALSSSLAPPAICSGTDFIYIPTSATPGGTFTWTRAAVAGISNLAGSGIGNPSETLTNTTAVPKNTTYVYTVSVAGCTNALPFSVVATVNPTPTLSSSLTPPAICSGTTFSYTPTSATAGSVFTWTRPAVAGISNPAGSGAGDPSEVLTNLASYPNFVTYTYRIAANNCQYNEDVVVAVNPTPNLSSTLTPSAICSGTAFHYTSTSATAGAVFNWTRAAIAGISNTASSGSGDPGEILTDTTSIAVNVTYVYSVTASSCINPLTYSVVVRVNPTPKLTSSLVPAAICSGSTFYYTPASTTPGASFAWTRAAVLGIGNLSRTGTGDPSEILTDTTANPVNVTYIYTVSGNSCTNASTFSVVVTVNPLPTLSSTLNPPAICSGTAFNYTPTSATTGVSFSWSRAAVIGISNPAAGGNFTINEILTNTTASPLHVTYMYKLIANGCSSPVNYNVVVTVNPEPVLSSNPSAPLICSGSVFNYTPTSSTTGALFSWTRAAVAGISNAAGVGTNSPNEVLTNTTAGAVSVTYTYTISAGVCSNPLTFDVAVVVDPPSVGGTITSNATVCSGSNGGVLTLSGQTGSVVRWEYSTDGSNTWNNITNTSLTQTYSNVPVTTVYHAVVQRGVCQEVNSSSVTITVDPVSVGGTVTSNASVCSGLNNGTLNLNGYTGVIQGWLSSTNNGLTWTSTGTPTPTFTYNNLTITTWYRAWVKSGVCSADTSLIAVITVNPNPIAAFTAPAVCFGQTSVFTNGSTVSSGTIVQNNWNFGDTTYTSTTTSQPVLITYNNAGTYSVKLTVTSDQGCISTLTQNYTVNALPDPHISSTGSMKFCFGGKDTLSVATGAGLSYLWSNGSTASRIVVNSGGTYSVHVTNSSSCSNSDSVSVVVFPLPIANAGRDTTIALGSSVVLNGSGGGNYLWTSSTSAVIAGLDYPSIADPTATPTETTTYFLTVTDANSCVSSDTVIVTIDVDYKVVISNVMTPNGDGNNDTWIILNIENYPNTQVTVVNVEGQQVYISTNYQNTWDGSNMSGKPLPDGTYYYFLKFENSTKFYTGGITIFHEK